MLSSFVRLIMPFAAWHMILYFLLQIETGSLVKYRLIVVISKKVADIGEEATRRQVIIACH